MTNNTSPIQSIEEILEGYAYDYNWSKRTKINKPSDFTKQAKSALLEYFESLIGEDEQNRRGFELHDERAIGRNQLRAEIRERIRSQK